MIEVRIFKNRKWVTYGGKLCNMVILIATSTLVKDNSPETVSNCTCIIAAGVLVNELGTRAFEINVYPTLGIDQSNAKMKFGRF